MPFLSLSFDVVKMFALDPFLTSVQLKIQLFTAFGMHSSQKQKCTIYFGIFTNKHRIFQPSIVINHPNIRTGILNENFYSIWVGFFLCVSPMFLIDWNISLCFGFILFCVLCGWCWTAIQHNFGWFFLSVLNHLVGTVDWDAWKPYILQISKNTRELQHKRIQIHCQYRVICVWRKCARTQIHASCRSTWFWAFMKMEQMIGFHILIVCALMPNTYAQLLYASIHRFAWFTLSAMSLRSVRCQQRWRYQQQQHVREVRLRENNMQEHIG